MSKNALTALAGIGVALLAGLVILWAQGYPAVPSYTALFSYSLFSKFAIVSTLNKATPLILTGLSAAVGFGSNCVNLGQPGQFLIGAMAVAAFGIVCDLPAPVMIPLAIMVALAAGALWAGIAAGFRRRFNMDEFITTLMLNFIADYFTLYLISGPMWDRATYSPMTKMTNPGCWLPMWDGLSAAFVVSCIAFVITWVIWDRSKLGYEWKVMGQNSVFSRVGGCNNEANFTRAMLVSGALAGLAGGLMVMGGMQHRFVKGMGANYAWDGVMIAIVAANGMVPTGLYALFFAAIQTGAMGMELETAVPSEFALVLQAIIVLFVVASRESTRLLINRLAANLRARAAAGAAKDIGKGVGTMHLVIEMLRSSVLAATPVLLAGLGGTYTYYANVFNIAMEGMMLIGAFTAVAGSYLAGSWVVGVLAGMAGGLVAALVFAVFAVYLKTDEFVTGTAINMLGLGGTTYALRQMFRVKGAFMSPMIRAIPRIRIPFICALPGIGPILSGHPFLVYVTLALAVLIEWHIFRTRYGLRLRAAGEDPRAVDSVGVSSDRIRAQAILISGALCGLAGVYLSLGYVTLFAENMSNGRGWIALAVIILTRGRPLGLLTMSLVFGFFDGLGLSLQSTKIPPQFTQMVPYIATIAALYLYSREKKRAPAGQVGQVGQAEQAGRAEKAGND